MSRLIIFDMDGTLIDSQDLIVAGMVTAFEGAGMIPPPRDDILSIVGLSLDEAVHTLRPDLPAAETKDLANAYRASFVEQRAKSGGEAIAPLYPGARAALEGLQTAGATMGVATGKAWRGLEHTYVTHDIGHFFSTSQTADGHPSKPHPSMVLKAMAEVGAHPDQTVMIGDTEFDIAMGRAAGVRTIGVSWGYHPVARLKAAQADMIIDGYDALAATLDELIGDPV